MYPESEDLALAPFTWMARWPEPCAESRTPLGAAQRDLINTGVWAYQVHVYHEALARRYGAGMRRRVRLRQEDLFSAPDGPALGRLLDLVEIALRIGRAEARRSRGELGMPLHGAEVVVALALIHYAGPVAQAEMDGAEGWGLNQHLTDCLARGRRRMEATIPRMFAGLGTEVTSHSVPAN